MLKEPRAGRVKTRLGRDIGMPAAASWFRHQSHALLRRLQDPRWQLVLAIAPDRAAYEMRIWPRNLARVGQGQGDLGTRIARQFRKLPGGPVVLIGADIPAISRRDIASGFAALANHDAVFGPAFDGGFWLVGLARRRALPPTLFRNVRWSTPDALSDTRTTLGALRVAPDLATLRDVDTAADLAR